MRDDRSRWFHIKSRDGMIPGFHLMRIQIQSQEHAHAAGPLKFQEPTVHQLLQKHPTAQLWLSEIRKKGNKIKSLPYKTGKVTLSIRFSGQLTDVRILLGPDDRALTTSEIPSLSGELGTVEFSPLQNSVQLNSSRWRSRNSQILSTGELISLTEIVTHVFPNRHNTRPNIRSLFTCIKPTQPQ